MFMKFKVQAIKWRRFTELTGSGIEISWHKDYVEGAIYRVKVYLDDEKKPRYSETVLDSKKKIHFNGKSPKRVKVRVTQEDDNEQSIGSIVPKIVAIEDNQCSVTEHSGEASYA